MKPEGNNGIAPSPRVAIAGWGAVSVLGASDAGFAQAVAQGRQGIGEVVSFDPEGLGFEKAAEMADFDAKPYLRSPKNFLDRNSQLAFAACELAARDAGLELPPPRKGDAGLSFGTGAGNAESMALFCRTLKEKGPRLVPPFVFPHTYPNTTASLLSIEYGLGGPHWVFNSGGAAGAQALLYAMHALREGRCRAMLAGGADAFGELVCRGARAAGWISPAGDGPEGCRPFAPDRNGTIWGEGAAVFCLTVEAQRAQKDQQAEKGPCAWLLGGGEGPSAATAMGKALADAGAAPGEVDLVVASGGGYVGADAEEAEALLALFGAACPPVFAPKALIGETFGASGPLNLAAALAAFASGASPAMRGGSAYPGLPLADGTGPAPKVALVNASHPDSGAWVSLVARAGGGGAAEGGRG